MKLQRPILVGGLGLSFSLWILQSLHTSVVQVGEISLFSLVLLGGVLLLKQRPQVHADVSDIIPVNREIVEQAIASSEAVINHLASEAEHQLGKLREQANQLYFEIDRQEINVAVTGGKSVGKTAIIQQLQPKFTSVKFHETAPLFVEAGETDTFTLAKVNTDDFVLFLTNGDLTDTEFQTLSQIKAVNQRALLVFNKQDQYMPDQRASVLLSLKKRLANVVATAASPLPIKVRKHQEDGSIQEWMEQSVADVQQLTGRLSEIIAQQKQQLVWATTMRKAVLLKTEAKNLLNGIRRDRSLPIIEQYQWIAATAAFANPVPALDILATVAINAQMVMDLGNVYQQKFSLDQAKAVAFEMGSLMLKLGLVEISTKAVSTVLKSNAVTFAVGGVVQGVSAAYLTRVAGFSLIQYFQSQEVSATGNLNVEKLGQTLQNVFQQQQQIAVLQGFVKQGVKRLLPQNA